MRDLFAYLKTLPAVQGRVRDHDVPFPFNIRRTVGLWKLLFLDGGRSSPILRNRRNGIAGPIWSTAPGHCAECHSPAQYPRRDHRGLRFTGGPSPDGQGGVPNITQQKLKKWTVDDIADMLEDGMTPDSGPVGGTMVEVVRNTVATDRGRSRGDGDLYQIVAGRRGPAAGK